MGECFRFQGIGLEFRGVWNTRIGSTKEIKVLGPFKGNGFRFNWAKQS